MADETFEAMLARYQTLVAGSVVPPISYKTYTELFKDLLQLLEQDVPHKHIMVAHGDDVNSSCLRCRLDFGIHVINHFLGMLVMTITLDGKLKTEHDLPGVLSNIGWSMFEKLIPAAPASNAAGN